MAKVNTNKPKFEAGKSYKWEESDEFVLAGMDFSIVYNTVKDIVERGSVPLQRIIDANNVLQAVFVKGIEEGVIVEMDSVISKPIDTLLDEAMRLNPDSIKDTLL